MFLIKSQAQCCAVQIFCLVIFDNISKKKEKKVNERKIKVTVKIDKEQYDKLKKLIDKLNEDVAIAKIIKLITFAYIDQISNIKPVNITSKEDKNIMIYLTEKEKKLLEKFAKKHFKKNSISLLIRSLLDIILKDKELEEKTKFLLILDKEMNFDYSYTDIIEKLYDTYKRTQLTPLQVFKKLFTMEEEEIIEKIEKDGYTIYITREKDKNN